MTLEIGRILWQLTFGSAVEGCQNSRKLTRKLQGERMYTLNRNAMDCQNSPRYFSKLQSRGFILIQEHPEFHINGSLSDFKDINGKSCICCSLSGNWALQSKRRTTICSANALIETGLYSHSQRERWTMNDGTHSLKTANHTAYSVKINSPIHKNLLGLKNNINIVWLYLILIISIFPKRSVNYSCNKGSE